MPHSFELHLPISVIDFDRTLTCGQVFRWNRFGNEWAGVDGPHWFTIRREESRISVVTNSSKSQFAEFFRLNDRLAVSNSKFLNLQAVPGIRPIHATNPVEVVFSFVCSANNHLSRITSLVQKLGQFGSVLIGAPHNLRTFPTLEQIALIRAKELRELGFGYRAETIPQVAVSILNRGGEAWLTSLRSSPYEDAINSLMSIRGIGRKLADCIALYGLGHLCAVPVDTHLWNFSTRMIFSEWKDKGITDLRYRAVGNWMRQEFGAQAGWVQLLIFAEEQLNWRARRKESQGR